MMESTATTPGRHTRPACERCHAAKTKCDREAPCNRCARKGYECNYAPLKARNPEERNLLAAMQNSAGQNAKQLPEHERRTWSVFFCMYKKFKQGSAAFWFNRQFMKMTHFLQQQAATGSAPALARIKAWCQALSIEVPKPQPNQELYETFDFGPEQNNTPVPAFNITIEQMKRDANQRHLPVLSVSHRGTVDVNSSFLDTFDCTRDELQDIILEADGGFLPWGGDLLSRLVATERDLSLYVHAVATNVDQLGIITTYPSTRVIPSIHFLHMSLKGGKTACYVVRAVHTEHIEMASFMLSSFFVFENVGKSPVPIAEPVEPQVSLLQVLETTQSKISGFNSQLPTKRFHQVGFDGRIPSPATDSPEHDSFEESEDEEWLSNLVYWASKEDGSL